MELLSQLVTKQQPTTIVFSLVVFSDKNGTGKEWREKKKTRGEGQDIKQQLSYQIPWTVVSLLLTQMITYDHLLNQIL